MAKVKLSNTNIAIGSGIGVGMAQTFLLGEYMDWDWPQIPGGWGTPAVIGNIVIGSCAALIWKYSKIKKPLKTFLGAYGITTIIGGVMNGIFPRVPAPVVGFGGNRHALGVSGLTGGVAAIPARDIPSSGGLRNGHYSASYYPGYSGNFYERPLTKAKGFGSDVTRNPMANIPTTIPYNTIIS